MKAKRVGDVELLSDGADLHGRSTAGEIDQRFFFIALPACECPPASLSDLHARDVNSAPATDHAFGLRRVSEDRNAFASPRNAEAAKTG